MTKLTPDLLLAAALRGESVPWPSGVSATYEADLFAAAVDHGVAALLSTAPALPTWPSTIQEVIRQHRREAAAMEVVRQQAHIDVLRTLAEAGVKALILKGSALAYTHYSHAWLRPRLDLDLLVSPDDRLRGSEVLERVGYAPATHFAGQLVTYQSQLRRTDRLGVIDRVDLHWRIANPHVFADTFTFDELNGQSVPVPQLGPSARTLSSAHALLLACLHRVAHHANSDRLIWLYDIRVLVDAMPREEIEHAAGLSAAKSLQAITSAGVHRAVDLVAAGLNSRDVGRLLAGTVQAQARGAEFLNQDRARVDDLMSDLRALPDWRSRFRLVREHLLPPADYIRKTYGLSNPMLLPFAYAHRAVVGAGKWFRVR
jgi:hypothetical protein